MSFRHRQTNERSYQSYFSLLYISSKYNYLSIKTNFTDRENIVFTRSFIKTDYFHWIKYLSSVEIFISYETNEH